MALHKVADVEFTLTERTEPFTLEEVFDFIDDTNIGKTDAHELKSRIVDVVKDTRNKAIDEFAEKIKDLIAKEVEDAYSSNDLCCEIFQSEIDEIAEQMKGV